MTKRETINKDIDELIDDCLLLVEMLPSRAEFDRLRKSHDVLIGALQAIATGDGFYGAQANEYKNIARAALAKVQSS